jgi:hypothetical protein
MQPGYGANADSTTDEFMQEAIREAKAGLAEGGIPIGSVLVIDRGVQFYMPRWTALKMQAGLRSVIISGRCCIQRFHRAICAVA